MNPIKKALLLSIAPGVGWEDIEKQGYSTQKILAGLFYPLLAIYAVSYFIRLFTLPDSSLTSCLTQGIIGYVAYFSTYYLVAIILSSTFTEVGQTKFALERLNVFVLFSLTFLVMLETLYNLLPYEFTPLKFLRLYLVVIVIRGCDFLGIFPHRKPLFITLATVMMIVMPLVIQHLFGLLF